MDVETGIYCVIGVQPKNNGDKKFISLVEWIFLRVGKSVDDSSIALFNEENTNFITNSSIYSSINNNNGQQQEEDSSLDINNNNTSSTKKVKDDSLVSMELQLSKGLGDEDTPPKMIFLLQLSKRITKIIMMGESDEGEKKNNK